jgi:hypothetical protein
MSTPVTADERAIAASERSRAMDRAFELMLLGAQAADRAYQFAVVGAHADAYDAHQRAADLYAQASAAYGEAAK